MPKKSFRLFYTEKAKKELSRLALSDVTKTISQIGQLTFPFPTQLNIKKMKDVPDFFRLKFGKVRVIFTINYESNSLIIRKIGYRKDIYR